MNEILEISSQVATPVGVVGLVCAFVFLSFAISKWHNVRVIAQLPEADRIRAVDKGLVEGGRVIDDLTKAQRFTIWMDGQRRRFISQLIYAILGATVFLICFYLVVKYPPPQPAEPVPAPSPAPDVKVTDIRFLHTDPETDPAKRVASNYAFNRIQVTLSNRGSVGCVVSGLRLVVKNHWCVAPLTGQGGIVESAATYHVILPPSLKPGEYAPTESLLWNLAPQETVSAEIITETKESVDGGPYEYPCTVGLEPSLPPNMTLIPIIHACIEFDLETGNTVRSVDFVFTLPNNKVFPGDEIGSADPQLWLSLHAENRVGGTESLLEVLRHNAALVDNVDAAAMLRSPQVSQFITWSKWINTSRITQ